MITYVLLYLFLKNIQIKKNFFPLNKALVLSCLMALDTMKTFQALRYLHLYEEMKKFARTGAPGWRLRRFWGGNVDMPRSREARSGYLEKKINKSRARIFYSS